MSLKHRVVLWSRALVLLLISVAVIALGAYALLVGLGWFDGGELALSSGQLLLKWTNPTFETRALWIFISLGVLLVGMLGLWLVLLPTRARKPAAYMIHKTPGLADYGGSSVSLSARGLQALMAYVLMRVPGVHEALPTLKLTKKGWVVRCRLYVWVEAELPELIAQAKQQLQGALEQHTGIPVVRIDVDADYHSWQHEGGRRALR